MSSYEAGHKKKGKRKATTTHDLYFFEGILRSLVLESSLLLEAPTDPVLMVAPSQTSSRRQVLIIVVTIFVFNFPERKKKRNAGIVSLELVTVSTTIFCARRE